MGEETGRVELKIPARNLYIGCAIWDFIIAISIKKLVDEDIRRSFKICFHSQEIASIHYTGYQERKLIFCLFLWFIIIYYRFFDIKPFSYIN